MSLNEKGKIEATIAANAEQFVSELDKARLAAQEMAEKTKSESKKASNAIEEAGRKLKDVFTTGAGQMKIIEKGFKAAMDIAKHFAMAAIESLQMTADFAKDAADSIKEVSAVYKDAKDKTDDYFRKLIELNNADELSNEQKAEQAMLLEKLKDRYSELGDAVVDASGKIQGLDEAFAKKLEHDQAVQLNMMDAQIAALKEAYDAQREIVGKATGWRSWIPGIANIANSKAESAAREQSNIGNQLRELQRKRNELAKETPAEDFMRRQKAKQQDADEKAAKKRAEDEKKASEQAAKAEEEASKRRIAAEKAVHDAARRYIDARKNMAKTLHDEQVRQAKSAADAEIAQLQRRRNALQRRMGRFGFSLEVNPDESSSERRKRIARQNLDASIATKQAQQAEGKRVHYTSKEEARIKEYQQTQSRIKKTEAEIAQIEAANKARDAAEAQKVASERFQEAATKQMEAASSLSTAVQTIQSLNYTSKFDTLIRSVNNIGSRFFIVK
jgi:hypothetical protein